MTVTCPACNKPNQVSASCARCGCDLSTLLTIATAATAHLREGRAACEDQDWREALRHAERSWRLRHARESAELAFLAESAAGRTDQALRWHRRAQATAAAKPYRCS